MSFKQKKINFEPRMKLTRRYNYVTGLKKIHYLLIAVHEKMSNSI